MSSKWSFLNHNENETHAIHAIDFILTRDGHPITLITTRRKDGIYHKDFTCIRIDKKFLTPDELWGELLAYEGEGKEFLDLLHGERANFSDIEEEDSFHDLVWGKTKEEAQQQLEVIATEGLCEISSTLDYVIATCKK